MQKFIVRGYVNELKYEDIQFKDKKTHEDKVVKKCECVVRNIEDDQLLPIVFWGLEKISNYFIDITEGTTVVASFGIKTTEHNKRFYINLNGVHIEKYGGIPIETKIATSNEKRDHYINENSKETTCEPTVAEREWEENLGNTNIQPSTDIDDLPF